MFLDENLWEWGEEEGWKVRYANNVCLYPLTSIKRVLMTHMVVVMSDMVVMSDLMS